MLGRMATRFLILSLFLSLSVPVTAMHHHHPHGGADAAAVCCLGGLAACFCCCLLARAPHGHTVAEMSNLGIGLVTSYFLAASAVNAATAAYDYYASQDVVDNKDNAGDDFKTATAFAALSSALMFFAGIGGIPDLVGPALASVFALLSTGTGIAAFVADIVAYSKVKDNNAISYNQEVSRALSISSLVMNSLAIVIHPLWLWYRISRGASPSSAA